MNFVVLEDPRAPLFTQELVEQFPKSSTVGINPRNTKGLIPTLNGSPTLTDNWLVLVDKRVGDTVIAELAGMKTCINVFYAKANNVNYIAALCREHGDCQIVDMLNMDEPSTINYVKTKLNVNESVARELVKRCKCYLPYIEESMLTLKSLQEPITINHVKEYIQKRSETTVFTVFYHLVGLKRKRLSELGLFLYQYRYAYPYIKKRLQKIFTETIKLYKDIELGKLGGDNIKDYLSENKMEVSEYFVRRIVLELHETMTVDELYLHKIIIDKTDNMPTLLSVLERGM